MANRKPAAAAAKRSLAKSAAEIEAEKKRKAEARAAAQRADEDKDKDEDKDDADDERAEDEDESRDADDTEDKDKDEDEDDSDDERDADDSDEDDAADDEADKRAAPGKRGNLTAAEIRKAAEAAVRADRVRGSKIREIAGQFGFPKLGERHANGETSVRAFKDLVLERLAERQKKRGNTTFAAAGAPELDEGRGARSQGGAAHSRDFDKGASEARALLGLK